VLVTVPWPSLNCAAEMASATGMVEIAWQLVSRPDGGWWCDGPRAVDRRSARRRGMSKREIAASLE
jgi:hypothetical protein